MIFQAKGRNAEDLQTIANLLAVCTFMQSLIHVYSLCNSLILTILSHAQKKKFVLDTGKILEFEAKRKVHNIRTHLAKNTFNRLVSRILIFLGVSGLVSSSNNPSHMCPISMLSPGSMRLDKQITCFTHVTPRIWNSISSAPPTLMSVIMTLNDLGVGVHHLNGRCLCAMQVVQVEMDKCLQERNAKSKSIGQLKAKGEDVSEVRALSNASSFFPSIRNLWSISFRHNIYIRARRLLFLRGRNVENKRAHVYMHVSCAVH